MDAAPVMTPSLTDGQLLREFALGRDQRAFHELVQRHQDLVFSTALRRTGHADTAADVVQNVFLGLAGKAARLSSRASLGGWLYKATLLEVARRQRDEGRRARRERRYAEEEANLTTDSNSMTDEDEAQRVRQLMPLLDEAMSGLAEQDREAVVLRFLQGLSLRETGAALGTTEEAARKRVARALEKLSVRFRRRGVTVSAALLAAAVLPEAVKAAPAGHTAVWAGVAAKAPALGWSGTLWLKAAALTKPQLMAACVAVAMVPVTWQARKIRHLESARSELSVRLNARTPQPEVPALVALKNQPDPLSVRPGTAATGGPEEKRGNRSDWRNRIGQWRELQRQQQRDARLVALQEQIGLEDFQLIAIAEATARADRALAAGSGKKHALLIPEDQAVIVAARDQTIAAVLDAAQWQDYERFCEEEERGSRELQANRLLGEVQATLHLTDLQKDQLFALFASEAARTDWQENPFPVESVNGELNEKMAEVFSEEQRRLWQQRIGVWGRLFGAGERGPGRRD